MSIRKNLLIAFFFLGISLFLVNGCFLLFQKNILYIPDQKQLIHQGEFQPYVQFHNDIPKNQGFTFPTIICRLPDLVQNFVTISLADVTQSLNYEKFESVQFLLFSIEYESGDRETLIDSNNPSQKYRLCNGDYSSCDMNHEDWMQSHQVKKRESILITVKGISTSKKGVEESFYYQQLWSYTERINIFTFMATWLVS